jgi:putative phage-type endonuclease
MHPRVQELLAKGPQADQRSEEWFRMRETMLTASDIAAALGQNHFKSPDTLILEKCGYKREQGFNVNTQRGIDLEPMVRCLYDQRTGSRTHEFGLEPHPVYSWLGGSVDGITESGILVEIKCPNKLCNKIPDYYFPQVQILMEINGLEECDFVQYHEPTGELKIIRVPRDRVWFEKSLPRLQKFWNQVLYKREHGVCEIDF